MRIVSIILGLFLSMSAYADWQFTKWGMTPEEVIAASNGTYKIDPSPNDPDDLIKGKYTSGSYTFEITFKFDNRRLYNVALELNHEEASMYCVQVEQDIDKKYKAEFYKKTTGPYLTNIFYGDKENNQTVAYVKAVLPMQGSKCGVYYAAYSQLENMKKREHRTTDGL